MTRILLILKVRSNNNKRNLINLRLKIKFKSLISQTQVMTKRKISNILILNSSYEKQSECKRESYQ
jgi:hypothetical protein